MVGGLAQLVHWIFKTGSQVGLDATRDLADLLVEPSSLAHGLGELLWPEDHQPDQQQKENLAAGQIEHEGSLERETRQSVTNLDGVSVNPPLRSPRQVLNFAHRGARGYAPENTMEAFFLALRLGADGLESDVWLTRDGVAVLDHDGVVKRGLRSVPIGRIDVGDLPPHIPRLEELLTRTSPEIPISLDVKDIDAFDAVARDCLANRLEHAKRVHLCHPDIAVLEARRASLADFSLVHSTRLSKMFQGPERHAARMREAGLDVVNMPYPDWSGGLVALFGRFGVRSFAWDCQHAQQIRAALAMKVDAIYSDWPDRVVDAVASRAISTD